MYADILEVCIWRMCIYILCIYEFVHTHTHSISLGRHSCTHETTMMKRGLCHVTFQNAWGTTGPGQQHMGPNSGRENTTTLKQAAARLKSSSALFQGSLQPFLRDSLRIGLVKSKKVQALHHARAHDSKATCLKASKHPLTLLWMTVRHCLETRASL